MPARLGVLLLHGFTGTPASFDRLEPPLRQLGLPLALPLLRGHGAPSPEALRGVGWTDWVADGEAALTDLQRQAERVVVLGHSMGALVALTLAADHPQRIDSLVLAAAPILLASPLAPGRPLQALAPLVQRLWDSWSIPKTYADPAQGACDHSYAWAPMDAVSTMLEFSRRSRSRLGEVRAPALILESRRDGVVARGNERALWNALGTPPEQKRLVRLERSHHELFRDCDRGAAIEAVLAFVGERLRA